MVGATLRTGQDALGVLGIHRPRASGDYADEDKSLVARFLPHVQRALQIKNQLNRAASVQRLSVETLDRTDTATVLVTANGLIVFANSQAEALLANGAGICVQRGKLATKLQSDTARLLSLIRDASDMAQARNEPGGVMDVRQPSLLPLTVLVAPFRVFFWECSNQARLSLFATPTVRSPRLPPCSPCFSLRPLKPELRRSWPSQCSDQRAASSWSRWPSRACWLQAALKRSTPAF
jgi:hypothetical protein